MPFQSDKRLYLTADGQVVEEGDERAATLLVGEGGQLSDEQAAQYGLTGKRRKAAAADAPADADKSSGDVPAAESPDGSDSAKSAPANTKAIDAPEGNK